MTAKWILFSCLVSSAIPCQPPDVPFGGNYVPFKKKYLFGDKVTYTCKKEFIRIGKEMRTCEINGKWSEQTPFCDAPTKLKNPVASTVWSLMLAANRAIDGDPSTCFSSKKGTGENFKVYLYDTAVVNYVRLYLPKGIVKIDIFTVKARTKKVCSHFDRDLDESQWVLLSCEDNDASSSIHIQDISASQNILEICEVEVYVKDDNWCRNPPDVFIPNGWLQVSRDKSTLKCAEGYKESDNVRMVCDKSEKWIGILQCDEILCDRYSSNVSGGEWRIDHNKISSGTTEKLICDKGYKLHGTPDTVRCLSDGTWSKSTAYCIETKSESKYSGIRNTIIVVSVVVVLLIFSCFGLVLFLILRKKSKPTVVIFKTDDNGYAIQSCSSGTVAYTEAEYSTIAYDTATFRNNSPRPPQTNPPVNLLDAYSKPADQWSLVDYSKVERAPPYSNSQESFDNNVADDNVFDSLKPSALYGT